MPQQRAGNTIATRATKHRPRIYYIPDWFLPTFALPLVPLHSQHFCIIGWGLYGLLHWFLFCKIITPCGAYSLVASLRYLVDLGLLWVLLGASRPPWQSQQLVPSCFQEPLILPYRVFLKNIIIAEVIFPGCYSQAGSCFAWGNSWYQGTGQMPLTNIIYEKGKRKQEPMIPSPAKWFTNQIRYSSRVTCRGA